MIVLSWSGNENLGSNLSCPKLRSCTPILWGCFARVTDLNMQICPPPSISFRLQAPTTPPGGRGGKLEDNCHIFPHPERTLPGVIFFQHTFFRPHGFFFADTLQPQVCGAAVHSPHCLDLFFDAMKDALFLKPQSRFFFSQARGGKLPFNLWTTWISYWNWRSAFSARSRLGFSGITPNKTNIFFFWEKASLLSIPPRPG